MRSKFPMHCNASETIIERAKELRKSMTEAEKALWQKIRNEKLGVKFRRQHPCNRFILDFYCHEKRLAIEIDGEYHFKRDQMEYDLGRAFEIENYDIKLIRFSNQEVLTNIKSVINEIKSHL